MERFLAEESRQAEGDAGISGEFDTLLGDGMKYIIKRNKYLWWVIRDERGRFVARCATWKIAKRIQRLLNLDTKQNKLILDIIGRGTDAEESGNN